MKKEIVEGLLISRNLNVDTIFISCLNEVQLQKNLRYPHLVEKLSEELSIKSSEVESAIKILIKSGLVKVAYRKDDNLYCTIPLPVRFEIIYNTVISKKEETGKKFEDTKSNVTEKFSTAKKKTKGFVNDVKSIDKEDLEEAGKKLKKKGKKILSKGLKKVGTRLGNLGEKMEE